jgi:hypothetical protein
MEEVDERAEKEMNHLNSRLPCWAGVLFILLAILACNFFQQPATNTLPSPVPGNSSEPASTIEATEVQSASDESTPDAPDPLDYLLNLRSIQINMTALYPDKTSNSVQGEIDAAGNLHLRFIPANIAPPDVTQNLEVPALPHDFEVYVVDGTDYQLNSEDNRWSAGPEPIDYWMKLSEQLHGPEGPGLWLDTLPKGSLQSAGEETVGGFTTQKADVNGAVAGQTITGSLWFDEESQALIQVELHIPAELLNAAGEPAQGELKIMLKAQKADIPAINVPK